MEVWSESLILTTRREARRRGLARIIRIPFEREQSITRAAGRQRASIIVIIIIWHTKFTKDLLQDRQTRQDKTDSLSKCALSALGRKGHYCTTATFARYIHKQKHIHTTYAAMSLVERPRSALFANLASLVIDCRVLGRR